MSKTGQHDRRETTAVMPHITRELLRKRAEHNEGMISTLEEISLHQEEIESINDVLNVCCRKLKIIYLQNNLIPKMENLFHMKDLEYLNLALNNIEKVEGLQSCEFLRKLDLTVNFIDYDTLEESIVHLQSRQNLTELYMMGNPSQVAWGDDFNSYVIGMLPQLMSLDGIEVTKSLAIKAKQKLPQLQKELKSLAKQKADEKVAKKAANDRIASEKAALKARKKEGKAIDVSNCTAGEVVVVEDVEEDDEEEEDENELMENTPETRVKIYKELAQQKKEKEDREKVNAPKERDYEKEQREAIESTRKKEEDIDKNGDIKQKNEGAWDFFWDEETKPGFVILEVNVARHLDSSLIDVDVHPTYVSMIIKSKTLRLRLPAEVRSESSKCQRSKVTGSLMITMPKLNPKENAVTIRGDKKAAAADAAARRQEALKTNRSSTTAKKVLPKKLSLQEQMIADAMAAASLEKEKSTSEGVSTALLDASIGRTEVDLNIVKKKNSDKKEDIDSIFEFESSSGTDSRVIELD